MTKYLRISILAASLFVVPFSESVAAQTGASSGTSGAGYSTGQTSNYNDNNSNWGYAGLLGLLGLAGLMKRRETTEDQRYNQSASTTK